MSNEKNSKKDALYIAVILVLAGLCWNLSTKASAPALQQAQMSTSPALTTSANVGAPNSSSEAIQPPQIYALIPASLTDVQEKQLQETTDPDVSEEEANRSPGLKTEVELSANNEQNGIEKSPSLPSSQSPRVRMPLSSGIYIGAGSGHWISENENGEIIKLEDGSIWQVDESDTVNSALWLPVSNITVIESQSAPGYDLINTDDHEKVSASLIKD